MKLAIVNVHCVYAGYRFARVDMLHSTEEGKADTFKATYYSKLCELEESLKNTRKYWKNGHNVFAGEVIEGNRSRLAIDCCDLSSSSVSDLHYANVFSSEVITLLTNELSALDDHYATASGECSDPHKTDYCPLCRVEKVSIMTNSGG